MVLSPATLVSHGKMPNVTTLGFRKRVGSRQVNGDLVETSSKVSIFENKQ